VICYRLAAFARSLPPTSSATTAPRARSSPVACAHASGLIVPSAALPGTRNVVLFGARVAAPYLAAPVSSLDLPASVTAQDARPLVSLIERVRFKRERHAALDAWAAGEAFGFVEPDWSLAAA
jgi:hypothetical protein